jgi:nucleoside-diphosphate-sugar epimerase
VYVSSTGVYGARKEVDAASPAHPSDERGIRRADEEQWISRGPWRSLILRAAAIYGPGRGVHAAVREGRVPRGSDSGVVSRIHVDDLAAIIDAGLFSGVSGAWPVADDEPCTTAEIIHWCLTAGGMGQRADFQTPATPSVAIAGRRVDGRKIREILGVELTYPSWRTGIPASLAE